MRRRIALLAFAAIPASVNTFAQNVTHTIEVTTALDVSGDPSQCSLREAFDNINAGKQVGTNSCGKPATAAGAATLVDATGLPSAIKPAAPVPHKAREAVLKASMNGVDQVQLLAVEGDAHLYLDGVILRNGLAPDYGGAVNVTGNASLTARRVAFLDNKAVLQGGAIHFDSTGTLEMSHVAINYNSAPSGGGMFVRNASSVSIDHARISRNLSTISGSAAEFGYGFNVRLADSRIEENVMGAGDMDLSRGTLVARSSIFVERCNFQDNSVGTGALNSVGGGALTLYGSDEFPASHVILDSRFHANGVTGAGGGAIHALSGSLFVDGSTFSGNLVTGFGGAMLIVSKDPVTVQNSTFIGNDVGLDMGAAIFITPRIEDWKPDPALPLGGDFKYKILNNTFADNTGGPQVNVGNNGAAASPVLFVNNILHSLAGVPGCGGSVGLLMTQRPNDNGPNAPNAQYPGSFCGVDIPTFATTLASLTTGWFYDMEYRKTILANAGDPVVCALVERDQFDRKRVCLMGAVESEPSAVFTPIQPWFL